MESLIKGYGKEKRLGYTALNQQDIYGSGNIAPNILNLGTTWR
jgi:hypothetical protein